MFLDARTLPRGTKLTCDVCIIGAGAAGLALAARFEKTNLEVLLIESGGFRPTPLASSLNEGRCNQTDYPFVSSRARVFGGTTTRWAGACIPLDAFDFEARPWLSHSGWPIGSADLEPYHTQTADFFGLPDGDTFQAELDASPFHVGNLQSKTVLFPEALDLGRKFKEWTHASRSLTCLLHATVTLLRQDAGGRRIEIIELCNDSDNAMTVTAQEIVLAAGGIENARLLLVTRAQTPHSRLHDLEALGRYYMEHPMKTLGILKMRHSDRRLAPFTHHHSDRGGRLLGTFGLSRACREKEHLMDMQVRVYRYHPLEKAPAILQGKALAKSPECREGMSYARNHAKHLGREILPYLGWHLRNKVCRRASFDHLRFTAFVEQEPDPENRILLSDEKDLFGVPLPRLHISESPFMRDSITRSLDVMAREFQASGFGELHTQPEEIAHLSPYDNYGLHHMGSTRMSSCPRDGVVDPNGRVHGMTNLHVAGSSLFPSGGSANPTFTLVALALRLADHLRRALGK